MYSNLVKLSDEELKARNKERMKEYNNRPEVVAKRIEYNAKPERKAKMKEHNERPKNIAKRKEWASSPEGKEWREEYEAKPETIKGLEEQPGKEPQEPKKELRPNFLHTVGVIGIWIAIILLLIAIVVLVKNVELIKSDAIAYGIQKNN